MLTTFDTILLVMALVSFPFLIWSGWRNVRTAKASLAWPSARGLAITSGPIKPGWRKRPEVTYSYSVNGVAYSGRRISFAARIPSHETPSTLARYPIGQSVDVRYSPDDPTECVLEPGVTNYVVAPLRWNIIWFSLIILLTLFTPFRFPSQAPAPVVTRVPKATPVGTPDDYPQNLQSSRRNYDDEDSRQDHHGFRCVVARSSQ